jgi:hypothetical protein
MEMHATFISSLVDRSVEQRQPEVGAQHGPSMAQLSKNAPAALLVVANAVDTLEMLETLETLKTLKTLKTLVLKPLVVDVPIVLIKQQYEEQQHLGWLYLMYTFQLLTQPF